MTHNPTTTRLPRSTSRPVQPSEPLGSDLEIAFDTRLKQIAPDAPLPEYEYRYMATRRWRFDRAWPLSMVAVELEGGVYSNGRHVRPAGFEADCEKYNAAVALGWRVFRFTAKMLDNDPYTCIQQVVRALEAL